MIGIKYPKVLPYPVGAIATKSFLVKPIGIDCIWIGLGFKNLSFDKLFFSLGCKDYN